MYTFAPTSHERRSAQTVLWQITETLVRLVAPILSFTADEVWEHLPAVAGREASVHLALFLKPEEIFSEDPAPLLEEWKDLLNIRDLALRLIEFARQEKHIGKSLEADVHIYAMGDWLAFLKQHIVGLKELLNVSSVFLPEGTPRREITLPRKEGQWLMTSTISSDLWLALCAASGHKCARCWNFMPEVSAYGIWQNVCNRCQSALKEMGIDPPQPEEPAK